MLSLLITFTVICCGHFLDAVIVIVIVIMQTEPVKC